jgi:hypothetical protein
MQQPDALPAHPADEPVRFIIHTQHIDDMICYDLLK